MLALDIFWYFIIAASVVFYTVLDGFDLGVGVLHLAVRSDHHRRIFLNAIGPVWDGNEVWLIIIGGALFSGFSPVYATFCSAFYIPFMIFLFGLILRAVAIEFRSKLESRVWRSFWDWSFGLSSLLIAFLLGLLLANLVRGIPLDQDGNFIGTFRDFFSGYTILCGFMVIALFLMHGTIFLLMKTEGDLHDRLRRLVNPLILTFVILYLLLTFLTLLFMPHMLDLMREYPWLFFVPVIAALAIANIPREINRSHDGLAFLSSIIAITALFSLFGIGTFPNMIRSSIFPDIYSLTLYNSIASPMTLKIITIVACIGVPLVIGYGWWVYHIFRGKVRLDESSY